VVVPYARLRILAGSGREDAGRASCATKKELQSVLGNRNIPSILVIRSDAVRSPIRPELQKLHFPLLGTFAKAWYQVMLTASRTC
jgi:hypothetical protein